MKFRLKHVLFLTQSCEMKGKMKQGFLKSIMTICLNVMLSSVVGGSMKGSVEAPTATSSPPPLVARRQLLTELRCLFQVLHSHSQNCSNALTGKNKKNQELKLSGRKIEKLHSAL